MAETLLIRGGESCKTFTDNPSEYLNQRKEDGSHSDDDDDDDDYDSDASSLNESYSEEIILSSDSDSDSDDDDNNGGWGSNPHFSSRWVICDLSRKPQKPIDLLQKLISGLPMSEPGDKRNYVYIYGYYRRSKGYGGYGIIFMDEFWNPTGGYYGVSKGRSYLYYLMLGIKRGLEIANGRGLARVTFSINSRTAAEHFNLLFKHPIMLNSYFHSQQDVADTNFCRKCLRNFMSLTAESFELLVPLIKQLIKLQLNINFKYREPCLVGDCHRVAYYLAKYGAEAFEEKMKQEGVSSDGVVEVELKTEEIEDLFYGVSSDGVVEVELKTEEIEDLFNGVSSDGVVEVELKTEEIEDLLIEDLF